MKTNHTKKNYQRHIKRPLDLALALPLSVSILPIMALIALLVFVRLGRPILFRQKRPGQQGRPFFIYKFRTMHDAVNKKGESLPDQARMDPFGKILRKTSMDEIPELINVLKGEMSIVGPRPLLMQYLDRYTQFQARRHEVIPGITGWAQVNGRNAISWEEKFCFDVWYVDNLSLALDLKIIAMTAMKVFKREGITSKGTATMTEFMGTEKMISDG